LRGCVLLETNTKYPWRNIVQFHKEIIELDQEEIFKLELDRGGCLNQSRCALLNHFASDILADTWIVPEESFGSIPLLNDIKMGKLTEGYLGGPCWLGWDPKKRTSYLSPFFYQHVQIGWNDEENAVIITPAEGRWDMPPFLFQKLDWLEFSSDTPLEELPFSIIEQACLKSETGDKSLTESIISEVISQIPVIPNLFSKYPLKQYKENPYPWMFFTFPAQAHSISVHLVPDYNALDLLLEADPNNIGGLRIFEGIPDPEAYNHSEITVDPIIPLNASQEAAVKGILDKKPITVISGPPGCGKSQVVVSLLLNAWAQGKSVLFASTTKAAVDVVFDRLKEFECEYPIAIRAGGKGRSTIAESLGKLQYLSITETSSQQEMSAIEKQISNIYKKKRDLQKFIDDKIPQRITQAKQAGWKAYVEAQKIAQEIEREREPFIRRIASIGYPEVPPESFAVEVFQPLKAWLDSIENCRYQVQNDDELRRECREKITSIEQERNQALRSLGYAAPAPTDCRWLTEGPGVEQFEQWLATYRTLLSDEAGQSFTVELKEQHRQWTGEGEARRWADNADELKEKIRQFTARHAGAMSDYQALLERDETTRKKLTQARLPEQLSFDLSLLDRWKCEYSHNLTLPNGILAALKRRTSENQLQQYEKGFRSYFPADVWSAFASSPKEGRQRLSELIDLVTQRSAVQKEWERFGTDRKLIENGLREIEESARSLKLPISLQQPSADAALREISSYVAEMTPVARDAAEAWSSYNEQEQLREELRRHALKFNSLVSSSPALAAWVAGQGSEFNRAVMSLLEKPALEQILKARTFCTDHHFSVLISAWKEAISQQKKIAINHSNYANIPSHEKRIADWWSEKPRYCAVDKVDRSDLPGDGDVLHRHLDECKKISDEWDALARGELGRKRQNKKEMVDRALENLKISYENIPASLRTKGIKDVLVPLIKQSGENIRWYNDEDEHVFNSFNPDRLGARIAQLNSRLGELSFALAKQKYLKRIGDSSYVLEDLDALYSHFKSTNYKAKGFPVEKYINALKAAPVWMTNAHQPQSFPMAPGVFDILIIDEASQCTLTNILPLIYRAKSLAVIGDRDQLPAIFAINTRKEKALAAKHDILDYPKFGHNDTTMFNLGLDFVPGGRKNMLQLVEHYRSHPLIIGFSNLYIYQMRLSLRRETIRADKNLSSGVFGLNVRGECVRGKTSWINQKEAEEVCSIIEGIRNNDALMNKSIGVVTPFAGQKGEIRNKLETKGLLTHDTLVDTVDAFQGSERDIMIFSPVISRGMTPGAAAWSDSSQRINVALTRARDLLIVVGDFEYCRRQDKILGRLIDYVETVTTLRDTSMEELELFSLMLMEGNELKITRNNLPRIHQRVGAIEVDFILRNPEKGINVVIEVDGKQHYYVMVDGSKYPVKYEGMQRFIEVNGEKGYLHTVGGDEFVKIDGTSYPVIQTDDSVVHDNVRDSFLRSEGYKVHRIHTQDIREKPAVVMNDLKKVLEIID